MYRTNNINLKNVFESLGFRFVRSVDQDNNLRYTCYELSYNYHELTDIYYYLDYKIVIIELDTENAYYQYQKFKSGKVMLEGIENSYKDAILKAFEGIREPLIEPFKEKSKYAFINKTKVILETVG